MEFDISKLTGFLKAAAEKIDKQYNVNGKIDGCEVSIFESEAYNLKLLGLVSAKDFNSIFGKTDMQAFCIDLKDQYICKQDNTYVDLSVPPPPLDLPKNLSIQTGDDYDYKSDPQYKKVLDFVIEDAKSHGKNLSDEELDKITGMILKKCKKYKISDLAPVIAQILGTESGGYVFNDIVMVNPGSQFKGVMQVNLEAICCMYGEQELNDIPIGGKNKKTGKQKTVSCKKPKSVYEGDFKKHFKQDADRIAELKRKYPTPKDLYLAMQKDVELGLEVGIIVFKSKISYSKGSIKNAISGYCGSQYSCNTIGCPPKIDISQRA